MSKYFSEIFKKLAPEGHAVLVMKKGDQDQGVGISVEHSTLLRSFNMAELKLTHLNISKILSSASVVLGT